MKLVLLLSFSIYEKLIQFCSIDELGTNYPKDMFDPHGWSEDSYYESLGEQSGLVFSKPMVLNLCSLRNPTSLLIMKKQPKCIPQHSNSFNENKNVYPLSVMSINRLLKFLN